jgi:hypothetical protein
MMRLDRPAPASVGIVIVCEREEADMRTLGVALFAGLALVAVAAASDVTGNWEVDATFDDSTISGGGFDCAFKQDGEQLTGACSGGTAPLTGEVKGQNITWRLRGAGNPAEATTFTGTVDQAGTGIKGRFTIADKGGRFTASKQ